MDNGRGECHHCCGRAGTHRRYEDAPVQGEERPLSCLHVLHNLLIQGHVVRSLPLVPLLISLHLLSRSDDGLHHSQET